MSKIKSTTKTKKRVDVVDTFTSFLDLNLNKSWKEVEPEYSKLKTKHHFNPKWPRNSTIESNGDIWINAKFASVNIKGRSTHFIDMKDGILKKS